MTTTNLLKTIGFCLLVAWVGAVSSETELFGMRSDSVGLYHQVTDSFYCNGSQECLEIVCAVFYNHTIFPPLAYIGVVPGSTCEFPREENILDLDVVWSTVNGFRSSTTLARSPRSTPGYAPIRTMATWPCTGTSTCFNSVCTMYTEPDIQPVNLVGIRPGAQNVSPTCLG